MVILQKCGWFCLQGHVVMGTQAVSPYQQVIEKTKSLSFRSQLLAMNIEKKLGAKTQDGVCEVEQGGGSATPKMLTQFEIMS